MMITMDYLNETKVEKEWNHNAPVLFCVEIDSDDQTVETEDLGENKDEDHADEEARLLGGSPNSGITNDADGVPGSKTRQADGQTSSQMYETPEKYGIRLE